MKKLKHFGIIVPVANEAGTIRRFCAEIFSQIRELGISATVFIVIDRASRDTTRQILARLAKKNPMLRIIDAPENRNVVDAYVRGHREAIRARCDYSIEIDGGFSHLPSEIGLFVQGLSQGHDCVFGIRPLTSPAYHVQFSRRVLSFGGTLLSKILLHLPYQDATSGYQGFSIAAAKKIFEKPLLSAGHFWHVEVKFRAQNLSFLEVPITYRFPSHGAIRLQVILNALQVLWVLMIDGNKYIVTTRHSQK